MKTYITEAAAVELYNELLDEQEVVIGSLVYRASRVLAEVDPIAYRVGFSDFVDSISDEYELLEE